MRLGLFTVCALLGVASAAPTGLGKRGGKKCTCMKNAGQNSGSKIVYDSGSSNAGSSWSGSSGISGIWVKDSEDSHLWVKTVVYVHLVPVMVPVTTTCTQTGTIVIENNITINVTVAPTVITYTKTTSTTTTETSTVTTSATGSVHPNSRPASSGATTYSSSIPAGSTTSTAYVQPTPMSKSSWPDHKVIGYYGIDEAKFMVPPAVPWNLLTHVCFAFASIGTDYSVNITSGASLMTTVFQNAISNGVKSILSIGGWGYGSSMYSEMVSSNETRAIFIESLKAVVNDYNITGIDLDWEYPGRPSDASVPYNETTDVPNFLILLDELRTEFGTNLTLSAAVAATTPFADDVSRFAELFDWVGLMMYDFATGPLNDTTSNAPLKGDVSAQSGVAAWFDAGLPKSKMVFGIPSYGRSFTLIDYNSPSTDGLVNPCSQTKPQGDSDQVAETGVWKWRNLVSQGVIVANASAGAGVYVAGDGWQQKFDYGTDTPYAWNNVTGEWITYDDPVSISYKREYAVSQGMAGMMVWEVAYDSDDGLLLQYMN